MTPVRIAVIDSGVFPNHSHILTPPSGGASFGPSSPHFTDTLGHGTAVMAAIQEKAPDAEYYALRVFHRALRTRVEHLLEALEWCVENHIDIANLSLGTANANHAPCFEAFLKTSGNLTIVAAASALPGSLTGVLGVDVDPACPRGEYRYHAPNFAASGHPRPIPGVPPERNLQGISFAVANLTGFAARAAAATTDRRPSTIRQLLAG